MRRGVWLLVLGVLAAALGAASAYAAGAATTTSTTTTGTTTTSTTATTTTSPTTTTRTTTTRTTTTTTAPTTTASSPGFSSLPPSYLSSGCVGAGAAAIAEPGRQVLVLGTPASDRGPSAYPTTAPIVRFVYSSATGSGCTTSRVSLGSVSLFGGVVTASSVESTHGRGAVSGFAIYGSPVTLQRGRAVRIGSWGEVTLDKTVGRLTAPLVVQLLTAHHSLPAGTTIAFAFGASPLVAHKSKLRKHPGSAGDGAGRAGGAGRAKEKHRPPPDFPEAADPFLSPGVLAPAARHNAVVALAMRYLGIRYQWGGASPKTGFDCSGLVTYVFAKLGVALPHYTVSQWTSPDGVWVSPHHLRAGDLVFFVGSDGTRKAPGHVGIYVGDGYLIDAPHTGSFVRIDRLSETRLADGYVGARRIDSQLLVARHLYDAKDGAAQPFPHPLSFAASDGGPLLLGAVQPTAEPIAATGSSLPLLIGGPLGGLLMVAIAAGAFLFLRRRIPSPPGGPSV
jgi:cell wall-associated NlpC family hydrolase